MIQIAGGVVVGLIVAVLAYAATRSGTLRVERATSINAPPEKIFPLINDFHRWASWSAYEKKDPAMKRTFSGADAGEGAVYEWDGNGNVGSGRMEIIGSSRPSKVTIKLDFITPFEGHSVADFTMEPDGASTSVRWAMHGPNRFIGKVMGVFINMDRMIGKDFEIGLANLKSVVEE